ncbi:hypothetical protein TNIN_155621 [Trichonephila inaurata madagascariensis]|uniref:Uncharacterized protein n=1 Tax=Trichonephila inaurata madagascariensis TaxID=2747483 RepID=A0A8X6XPI7_9ARAC|nr:hypothetical protein TNIN_155621 [Trichonephila inaurata madagascariensis]
MKNSLFLFLTTVCVFSLACAQEDDCREKGREISRISIRIANSDDPPHCAQSEQFMNAAKYFGTEEEAKYKGEFKKMVAEYDDEEKQKIKECIKEVSEGMISEVEGMTEECIERSRAWFEDFASV